MIRPWVPADGDTRCQECGRDNPCWFADNDLWNAVMPDDGGVLCPTCFLLRAPQGRAYRVSVEVIAPASTPSAKESQRPGDPS